MSENRRGGIFLTHTVGYMGEFTSQKTQPIMATNSIKVLKEDIYTHTQKKTISTHDGKKQRHKKSEMPEIH